MYRLSYKNAILICILLSVGAIVVGSAFTMSSKEEFDDNLMILSANEEELNYSTQSFEDETIAHTEQIQNIITKLLDSYNRSGSIILNSRQLDWEIYYRLLRNFINNVAS